MLLTNVNTKMIENSARRQHCNGWMLGDNSLNPGLLRKIKRTSIEKCLIST